MSSESLSSSSISEDARAEVMSGLFSDLQIARFNEIYYQMLAKNKRGLLTGANFIISISSSAAVVAIMSTHQVGKITLTALAGAAAISAIATLVFQWDSKASVNERAALGYGIARERIKRLLGDMKLSELSDSHMARIEEVHALELAVGALDESANESVREKAWEQALKELPSDQAWSIV